MDDSILSIGIDEARMACRNISDLEQRTKAAMSAMKGHWLVTEEPSQFKAAIAAAMLETADDHIANQLAASHRNLSRMSHAMAASTVGVDVADMHIEDEGNLPILAWWKEAE